MSIYIVSVNDAGDAGFTGPFASETVARIAAEHIQNPRLCRVEWLDGEQP